MNFAGQHFYAHDYFVSTVGADEENKDAIISNGSSTLTDALIN